MQPKVSILIRTKNEEVWVEKVIEKLFAQTYKNLEIIIVDSGSSDKTLGIVAKFPEIKLRQIKSEEFNYSAAINIGVRASDAKYIGIFSGHSVPYSLQMIEKAVDLLEKNINVAAISGNYFALSDASLFDQFTGYLNYLRKPKIEHQAVWLTNTHSLIRRERWEEYNFDESLLEGCEDYDWAVEMISRGYDVIKTKDFTVRHSHNHVPNSQSWKEQNIGWQRIIGEINQKTRPTV
jgi:rhamnosyltransferase